jgi:serine/threonine protein kinase
VDKIYISCIDDTDAVREQISSALLTAAQQAKLGGKEVPHIYTVIKKWAADQRERAEPRDRPGKGGEGERKKARSYFPWDAFVECFPGYDSYLLERACEFLHDQGEIFLAKRFVNNKKANIVCPDIQWLAKAFCAVVTFRHNWVKDGILRQEALVHIWRDYNVVDTQDMLAIMALFEKFNIAFARREDGVWIIPSMLPAEPPPAALELPADLTHSRLYRLSVVPSGAFGQVLARLLEWNDVKVLASWRFGIILRGSRDVAALTVDDTDIALRVFKGSRLKSEDQQSLGSTAVGAGTLLRRLDEELQQIFKFVFRRMNAVPLETFILCPHCIADGVAEDECKWLKYDDVVRLVLSGDATYRCSGGEVPLERMGEDLTLGYVQAFPSNAVKVEKEALARGGFGMIFRGVMRNGARIVVKELIMEPGTEVSLFADFQREVSLMAQLRHENLVLMHGILLSPLRMVLELCSEGDLLGALRKGRIKDAALKLRMATDVAQGMNFLHSLVPPLAHRDLRSPNVLLMSLKANSKEPVAKVADFGLTAAASSRLQQELLTWQWMAPEAFLGENYTETCDLYSYGMILWEIYTGTGEIPFESLAAQEKNKKKQAREFMNEIIHKGLRPGCGPEFPEDVTALILRLWEKDAATRPSFAVCLELLQGLQSGIKRPEGILKALLSRDRGRAQPPALRKNVPVMNMAVSSMAGAFREPMVSCAVRPSVSGFRETIWLGGGQGSVLVVDSSGTRLHERKAAHAGAVKVLQSLATDGSVWSGGADGMVKRWLVVIPPPQSASPVLSGSPGLPLSAVASAPTSSPVASPAPRPARSMANSGSSGSGWSTAASPRAAVGAGVTIGRRAAATAAESHSPVLAAKPPQKSRDSNPQIVPVVAPAAPGLRMSNPSVPAGRSSLVRRRQPPPEFECVQCPDQPHGKAEIRAMLAMDQLGVMVVGDSRGTVAVFSREGAVLFKTKLPLGIKAMCRESDSRIWISEGASLHRVEIDAELQLEVAHSFRATHETGFVGLALAGLMLWASDGPDVKLIDTASDTVVKIVQQPAATAINCMACVAAYGQPTVWCGSNGLVSLWNVNKKSSIKSFVDLQGEVLFIQEVGENLVLVSYDGKLHVFDLHTTQN